MRARAPALALCLSLAACAADAAPMLPPEEVSFDAVVPLCEGAATCVNADVTEAQVGGVRVIHRPLPGAPITSVRILLDGGASEWTPRLAHAEAILFRLIAWWGSAPRAGAAFDSEVARIGGRFSTSQGVDFAHVSIAAPALHFEVALALVAEAALSPPIPMHDADLDHVKSVQRSQLESRYEEPGSAASHTAWDLVYGGHPYDMMVESIDEVDAVGVDDVVEAADRLLAGGRVTVVVVGDVPWERVRDAVERRLGTLESGERLVVSLPEPMPSERRAEVLDFPDAPNWHVRGYFPAPPTTDPDYPPLLVGLSALDDRLFDELRTARGLVYTAGAGLADYRANHGGVWLSTVHPAEALAAFHEVLTAIQRDGLEPYELEAARAQYLTGFVSGNDTAAGLSWTLADWELTAGDRELADDHVAALEEVTAEQAADALRRYLPELRLAAAGAGEPLTEAMLLGAVATP